MLRGRKIGTTGVDLLDKHKACVALAMDPRCRPALPVGIFLLNAFNTKTSRCDWSISNIARELDMTERTVHRAINKLRECGWLSWKRHGGKHLTNAYSFDWTALKAARSNLSPAAQDESEGETKRVPTPDISVTPPLTNVSETPDSGVTQNLKETFKENLNKSTNQKTARQKQEGRRKPERTQQSSQLGLRAFSVVYDAATATAGVARIKARQRVQKVLSENSLWVVAMENDSAFEAAILAEQNKPGTCLQAFHAALDQLVDNSGELALCQ